MSAYKVRFEGGDGSELVGMVHQPAGPFRAWALFAHCFTCSKDLKAANVIAEELASRGLAVLRFDFTGLGESSGEFAEQTFSHNIGDLVAAADFLRRDHQAPRILIGHSLGGAAVLAAAEQIPESLAVATIGAPADPEHVAHLLADVREEIEARGEAEVVIGGRNFCIKRDFLDDLARTSLRERMKSLGRALLIAHSPIDNVVGIENARLLYDAAKHPKSFLTLDKADHLLSRRADARYVAQVLSAWVERYLPEMPEHSGSGEADVVVRGGPYGFANHVVAGKHHLRADEPDSIPGGTDSGPSPYQFLSAALGSCTAMTLRMYADRKKWPLAGVTVTLDHDKIHAEDCASCESKRGKVDRIRRVIVLEGDLDEEQRHRLLEIADRCPVHRTLHSEVLVESELG
jgi:putative redox protein